MDVEHLNINPGEKDVTIRLIELQKENVLPVQEPLQVSLKGVLGCVHEYLSKRLATGQFTEDRCHILVDREAMEITLVTNETDKRNTAVITGQLDLYPKFVQFGINTDKQWEPSQLSRFFKLHRAFFSDSVKNMELVSILKNFKAKIQQNVENSRQDNGSRTDNFSQIVNSNLPSSFVVNMPIFKGRPTESIEVELIADVDGRDVKLSLCSPGAAVVIETERDKAIDEQLDLIRSLAPGIAIIEQ